MSTPILGKDADIEIAGSPVGYAQNIRVGGSADLIKEYKIGAQTPEVLEYGNRSFPISMDAMYLNKTYADDVLNGTKVDIVVYPEGKTVGKPMVTLGSSVITSWEMTIVQDGVILEGVRAEGKTMTWATVPA